MKPLLAVILGLLCLAAEGRADEQVRRVQEELRKRNLYFGEVDGRKTDEIAGALRRFQARKGLAASGELTPATLRSLDIRTSASTAEEWPEEPVLRSDAARELLESDRKVLEDLKDADLTPVAEGPEVASTPETPVDTSAPAPAKPGVPTPCKAAAPVVPTENEEQIKEFVQRYLDACTTNNLDAEMRFYAERVNYFDHGEVGRDFVARDVQRYYKQWPQRQYKLLELHLAPTVGKMLEVVFQISFRYQGKREVTGSTINHFVVEPSDDGYHFVSLREKRLGR